MVVHNMLTSDQKWVTVSLPDDTPEEIVNQLHAAFADVTLAGRNVQSLTEPGRFAVMPS